MRKLLCREKDKDVVATLRKVRHVLTYGCPEKGEKKINTLEKKYISFSQTVLELDKMDITEPVIISSYLSCLLYPIR